jgi:hypothetical protein
LQGSKCSSTPAQQTSCAHGLHLHSCNKCDLLLLLVLMLMLLLLLLLLLLVMAPVLARTHSQLKHAYRLPGASCACSC